MMSRVAKISTTVREAIVFVSLVIIVSSVIVAQVYDQLRSDAFLTAFEEHTKEMDTFLAWWAKYTPLIDTNEARIQIEAQNGTLAPYSCEAVFMRQHNVIIARAK